MLIVISYSLNFTVMKSYQEVERDIFDHDMTTFRENIVEELVRLEIALSDWAKWDASYAFIDSGDTAFIDENISKSAYRDLSLDYILIFSPEDRVLYARRYNEASDALEPVDKELTQTLKVYKNQTGIFRIGEELILISSTGITDNEGVAPPRGLMAFGYTLDGKTQERIERENDLSMTVTLSRNYSFPEVSNPYGVYQTIVSEGQSSIGHVTIKVINTDEVVDLKTEMKHSIQTLGQTYINKGILNLFILLTIFALIIHVTVGRVVVDRIIELNNQVNAITKVKSSSERVRIKGVDELGELSQNINLMLTELEQMHIEVAHHAYYDSMTGLLNRRMGFEKLSEAMKAADSGAGQLSIVYLDLNDLKKINDKYGHKEGDALIKDTVNVLEKSINKVKHIVRMGGDEFMIILPDVDAAETERVLEGVQKRVDEVNQERDKAYNISFSYGVAQYQKGQNIDHYIEQADEKMYRAKKIYREKSRLT
jgi:diguanylate cyclase (GGDEF)-like protein